MKIKDHCMIVLEKKGSMVITFMEILVHMGLIHMNSLMLSLVVLTRFLEIAWPLGNFITVRK